MDEYITIKDIDGNYHYYPSIDAIPANDPLFNKLDVMQSLREKTDINGLKAYYCRGYRETRTHCINVLQEHLENIIKASNANNLDKEKHINYLKKELREFLVHTDWFLRQRTDQRVICNLSIIQCVETGLLFPNITYAEKLMNLTATALSKHLNGKNKSCGGFHFIKISI